MFNFIFPKCCRLPSLVISSNCQQRLKRVYLRSVHPQETATLLATIARTYRSRVLSKRVLREQ